MLIKRFLLPFCIFYLAIASAVAETPLEGNEIDKIDAKRHFAETTDSPSTHNHRLFLIIERQVDLGKRQDAMKTVRAMFDSGDEVAIRLRDHGLHILGKDYLQEGNVKKALNITQMMSHNGYHQGLFLLNIAETQLNEEGCHRAVLLQQQAAVYLQAILKERQVNGGTYFDNLIVGWNRVLEACAKIQIGRGYLIGARESVRRMFTELTSEENYEERVDKLIHQRDQALVRVVTEYERTGRSHTARDLAQEIKTNEIRETILNYINDVSDFSWPPDANDTTDMPKSFSSWPPKKASSGLEILPITLPNEGTPSIWDDINLSP